VRLVELRERNEGKTLEFKRDLSSPEGILKCLTIERYYVRVSHRATGACRIDSPQSAEDKVLMAPNQTANGLV
jgi:hypothetical protein